MHIITYYILSVLREYCISRSSTIHLSVSYTRLVWQGRFIKINILGQEVSDYDSYYFSRDFWEFGSETKDSHNIKFLS